MPLFTWQCDTCNKVTRRLLPIRPALTACNCGGKNDFTINTTTRIIEIRDNGLQPRKVEQLANIQELIKNRDDKA